MIDNNTADDLPIVRLDVNDFTDSRPSFDYVPNLIIITRREFTWTFQYRSFSLPLRWTAHASPSARVSRVLVQDGSCS